MNKLRSYLRKVLGAFDIPRVPKTPPKPKSPLRVQFETEWTEATNSASRALNLAALGTVSGVCLLLQELLCSGQKIHTALAKMDDDRKNRARIDRMNAFFGDEEKFLAPAGWEKQRPGDELL